VKVVIDTNVLISGIFWQGLPFEVLKLWVNGSIEVVVTEKILEEYYRNITKIDNKKRVSEHWIGAFLS
jgi:putative PIN family toxin of toxin-antitoxin system